MSGHGAGGAADYIPPHPARISSWGRPDDLEGLAGTCNTTEDLDNGHIVMLAVGGSFC